MSPSSTAKPSDLGLVGKLREVARTAASTQRRWTWSDQVLVVRVCEQLEGIADEVGHMDARLTGVLRGQGGKK